jgi:nicotinic acid phosphoribosyltransferase
LSALHVRSALIPCSSALWPLTSPARTRAHGANRKAVIINRSIMEDECEANRQRVRCHDIHHVTSSHIVSSIPLAVFADSYKTTHPLQYPDCEKMVAYGEFRCGYDKDKEDTRMVHYGIRHIVETYLHRQWTEQDLQVAETFYSTHRSGGTALPWPKKLFQRIVRENKGYFPIRVQALKEGTCTHVRVPVYQITAQGDFAPLCLFFETLLTQIWYPSTVATLSRRARDVIESAFEKAGDGGAASALVASRLHDFGLRGCTCGEQGIIGGCAHLLNFDGTDTMPAAFHAQFHLNKGKPVGSSIPATVRLPRRDDPFYVCNIAQSLVDRWFPSPLYQGF